MTEEAQPKPAKSNDAATERAKARKQQRLTERKQDRVTGRKAAQVAARGAKTEADTPKG